MKQSQKPVAPKTEPEYRMMGKPIEKSNLGIIEIGALIIWAIFMALWFYAGIMELFK